MCIRDRRRIVSAAQDGNIVKRAKWFIGGGVHPCGVGMPSAIRLKRNAVSPVSYTHLDVYKRQLAECELRNQRDPDGLLRAYRKFLVRQLAGPRCADSLATPQAAGGVRKGADPREFFNETLAPLSPRCV